MSFLSLSKSKTPDYLFQGIPEQRVTEYDLRITRNFEQSISRIKRYSDSDFNNTLYEWNQLGRAVQESPSLAIFKKNLLLGIRPVRNPVYNICDIPGVKLLTRLRVNFSSLNSIDFAITLNA